jgi:hypothetical protein
MYTILALLLCSVSEVKSFSKRRNLHLKTSRLLVRNSELHMSASIDPLLSTQENAMINLFERVRPSVVYVSTFLQAFNPLLMNVMEIPSQTGSGATQKLAISRFHYATAGQNLIICNK